MTLTHRLPLRYLRILFVLVLGVVAAGIMNVAAPRTASALCSRPAMVGTWRNINPDTRSITRVDIDFVCGDQVLCDTEGHCTGGESYYTLHPYGKCHPTDCDWGSRRAESRSGGWQRATFVKSYKTSYVWVKTYEYYGRTYLRVYTWTDFTAADGRTDYSTDEWMLP